MFSNLSEPQSCDLYISSLIIVKIKNPEAQTTGFSILYKNFLIQILIEYTIENKTHIISRYSKRFKLIDESYNANPLSVKNAINNFDLIKKDKFKKYLLLGDMLELGSKSKKYHTDLSKVINKSNIDKVFIKGEKTLFTYKNLHKSKQGNILQNKDDIDLILSNIINNNDQLMIKGSNATGLNILSKKMIKGSNVI